MWPRVWGFAKLVATALLSTLIEIPILLISLRSAIDLRVEVVAEMWLREERSVRIPYLKD